MRSASATEPSLPVVDSESFDMASEPARRLVQLHTPRLHRPILPASKPHPKLGQSPPFVQTDLRELKLAPPRIVSVSEEQFIRAVEILAEMLAERSEFRPDRFALWEAVVGRGGLEPPTSALSARRSAS
jgi:hypothetical protein